MDAPAEGLARAENVGSNICVNICCLMWGRTFVDSWLVFPAPLEVRGSARKGVQLFWPTVSSWARGKGTLYIRVAGGHLCFLLTRPLGFFIEINVSLSSVLVSAQRFSSCLVLVLLRSVNDRPCLLRSYERPIVLASVSGSRLSFSSSITNYHPASRNITRLVPP